MSVVEDLSRRRGGREARKALRARPIPREEAAVRPGMEGGKYKPLSERDMERIHETALELLETVGLGQAIPSCIEALTAKGCLHERAGPAVLPARARSKTRSPFARANSCSMAAIPSTTWSPGATRSISAPPALPSTSSMSRPAPIANRYLADLYDCARIVDLCDHIHFFQRTHHRARHAHRA